jgi:hypothetical protein
MCRLRERKTENTEAWYKSVLPEQQENIVKQEENKKGHIKRTKRNVMKNNLNGYKSVMWERNVGNYTNKWTELDKAFKADLQAAETRKEKYWQIRPMR